MNNLHLYRCEHPKRTRAKCPFHKHLCYGEKQEFYDTTRIFFDCGTMADYGYGYYKQPKLYKKITIFREGKGYTVWAPYAGWLMLARMVPLNKARRIAKLRSAKNGIIVEKLS